MYVEIPEHINIQVSALKENGYDISFDNNPIEAICGFCIYDKEHNENIVQTLQWPIFGKPLICLEEEVCLEEFTRFMCGQNVYKFSIAKPELKFAAIKYHTDTHKSELKTIALSRLKGYSLKLRKKARMVFDDLPNPPKPLYFSSI